jgi:hypothetical protein
MAIYSLFDSALRRFYNGRMPIFLKSIDPESGWINLP